MLSPQLIGKKVLTIEGYTIYVNAGVIIAMRSMILSKHKKIQKMEKGYELKAKSLKGVWRNSGEQFRLIFLKATVFVLISLFVVIAANAQVTVSPLFFGQNAWMPDTVGNYASCPHPPCYVNGKLYNNWSKVENSHAVIIRYGGNNSDKNMPTNYQYCRMIDSIRANGMEPIIQVAFNNYEYSSTQAANLVTYLNVTKGKNIKYWSIGNEENNNYGYTASSIATYYKAYASAMKSADTSIKIIGPESAWYDQSTYDKLVGGVNDITGTDANGRYYVDIISFHYYPFDSAQTRSTVISKMTDPYQFRANLAYLKHRIDSVSTAHGRTGYYALKLAVTEANIAWRNKTNDGLYGLGTLSFIGGQFWAEMMCLSMENSVEFINFWSVIEGSSNVYDLGYLDRSTAVPRPTYYHFQMVAEHFAGATYYPTVAESGNPNKNVKAYVCKNGSEVKILVLNQNTNSTTNDASVSSVSVSMTTSAPTGSGTYKFHVTANVPGLSFGEKTITGLVNEGTYINTYDGSGTLTEDCYYKLYGTNALSYTCTSHGCTTAAVTASSNSPVCSGTTLNLSATNITGASYSWTGPNSFTSTSRTPSISSATTANAGTYTVTATSPGCTPSTSTVTVAVSNAPTASASSNSPVCESATINLSANTVAGASYSWAGPDGWTSTSEDPSRTGATDVMGGTYTLTITANGCTPATSTTTVSVPQFAYITPAGPTTFCSGGSVVLNGSTGTGWLYQWKKDGTNISGATASSYTATVTGSYQLKITDGSCIDWSSPVSVTASGSATTPTAGGNSPACDGGNIYLTASTVSGATYNWSGPNGFSSTQQNPVITNCTNVNNGTYSVTATVGGCTSAPGTKSIVVNNIPSAPTASSNSPVCQSGTVQFSANTISGATYSWTGPDGWTSSAEDPSRTGAAVTMAGTYSVTVTVGGCTSNAATTTLDVPDFASIGTSGPTTFCSGQNVTLYAATGTGYAWQWIKNGTNISGATANNYVASTAGDYQVKITKNSGTCAAWSAPRTVTISSGLVATITPADKTDVCSPQTVLLYANTCTGAGWTYQWLKKDVNGVYQNISGATSSSYTATSSGWYQVRVTSGASNQWSAGQQVTISSCRVAGEEQDNAVAFNTDLNTDASFVSVYPNPTDGQFTLVVNSNDTTGEAIHVEVLDPLGQLIVRTSTNTVRGTATEIPMGIAADQPDGLYIVRVTIGNSVMFSKLTLSR